MSVWGKVFQRKGRSGWWARFTFIDPSTGRRRNLVRHAKNRSAAKDILNRLQLEYEQGGGMSFDYEHATFADLASYYGATFVTEAEFRDGRKISGLRSIASTKGRLKVLREYFGQKRLRSLTYGDVRRYQHDRLHAPTRTGRPRAIATVNRELQLLRRMLNIAFQENWILRNPFTLGDRLISPADEKKRERILSKAEEEALLDSCGHGYLRAIVICALDTGMRRGEILKLRWSDVDLPGARLHVRGTNTKTLTSREVGITKRLATELKRLRLSHGGELDDLVFGIKDNVKKSFTSARNAASLPGLRFHDLRHTAATRLVQGSLGLAEVGRILGHAQPQTTYRYVNADDATLSRAAAVFDRLNEDASRSERRVIRDFA